MSSKKDLFNLVTVGDSQTGKTSLLSSLKNGKIPQNSSIPEIFDTCSHKIKVDGHKFELGLWDTAGAEKYESLRRLCYPTCDVFVVCFSVNSRKSFNNVKTKWLPEIKKHRPTTPLVIVATKQDLRPRNSLARNVLPLTGDVPAPVDGFVQFHEGLALANEVAAFAFMECSALGDRGVKEVFENATRAVLQNTEEMKSQDKQRRRTSNGGGLLKMLKK